MSQFYKIKERVEAGMHYLVLYDGNGELVANGGSTGKQYTAVVDIPAGLAIKTVSLQPDGTIVLTAGIVVTKIV